jgi:hypothetical protein
MYKVQVTLPFRANAAQQALMKVDAQLELVANIPDTDEMRVDLGETWLQASLSQGGGYSSYGQ